MVGKSTRAIKLPELSGGTDSQVLSWHCQKLNDELEFMTVTCGPCDFMTISRYVNNKEVALIAIPVPRNYQTWIDAMNDGLIKLGFTLVYEVYKPCEHRTVESRDIVNYMVSDFLGLG